MNTDDLNRTVFISDNLPFLKALDSESIDLVCIDPPFGKNQTFVGNIRPPLTEHERKVERDLMASWGVSDPDSAYEIGLEFPDQSGTTARFKDIWDFRVRIYREWLDDLQNTLPAAWWQIQSTRYSHSDSIAAYIAFMVERMIEIKRILKPAGMVYLHCDHSANAYLRQMMDAVFGPNNFRNEIAWQTHNSPQRGSQHQPKSWGKVYETILFYAKSNLASIKPFRPLTDEERLDKFNLVDEKGRRYYDDSAHIWSSPNMGARPNLCYEWKGFVNPHPSGWQLSKECMDEEFKKGNFVILENGKLQRRMYEDDWQGASVGSLWTRDEVPNTSPSERTGYPTQKPQALAKRIIEASTEPGDIVLDCFAGCAYVPVAAELTDRKWIACDMSPRAWTVVRRQFHKQRDLAIRTAGEIADEDTTFRWDNIKKSINVRGPYELPTRSSIEEPQRLAMKALPEIQFRSRPHENSDQIWDAFVQNWGTECWYCGTVKAADRRELQLDHVEPNLQDGTNDDCWNRALACAPCNSDKSNVLSVEATMERALEAGRIQTEELKQEMLTRFEARRRWARERWDQINPNTLL